MSGFTFTPYGELCEGDEFVRIGGRPVLLKDIEGVRDGGRFTPSGFGAGERGLLIYWLVRKPGGLDEKPLTPLTQGMGSGFDSSIDDQGGEADASSRV